MLHVLRAAYNHQQQKKLVLRPFLRDKMASEQSVILSVIIIRPYSPRSMVERE